MEKNKILISLLILFCFAIISQISFAEQSIISSTKELKLTLTKIDPSPIQIGQTTKLTFEVVNMESTSLINIEFGLSGAYPFTVKSEPTIIKELKPSEKYEISFDLFTNEEAKEGDYYVSLQFTSPKREGVAACCWNGEQQA